MKRAIVTGANGFVGSAVVKRLSEEGVQIKAVVRGRESDVSTIEKLHGVEIIYCDLSEMEKLPQMIKERGFDIFYHFAWAGVSGKARGDMRLQITNIEGTVCATEVCAKMGCKRFVGIGTLAQYDCLVYTAEDDSEPLLTSSYASAKVAAHHFSKISCVSLGIEHVWIYLSNIYGIGDRSNNFVNFAINHILNSNHPAFTDGMQLYDFLDIEDASAGIIKVGEKGKSLRSYYIGSGKCRKLRDYIETIHEKVAPDKEIYLGEIPFRGRSLDRQMYNCEKLFSDTGFRAVIPFEVGIDRLLAWQRKGI